MAAQLARAQNSENRVVSRRGSLLVSGPNWQADAEATVTTLQVSQEAGVFRSVFTLGRPKFLFYSVIMHGLGAAAAHATTGRFDLPLFLAAQGMVSTLHLATHYCNEFFDLTADRMNTTFTRWTGGSRVLVDGRLPPVVALAISLSMITFFVAGLAYAWLGRPTLVADVPRGCWALAAVALSLAWEYSAPPLKLTSRGLGEAVVASMLCVILPAMGFLLQNGEPNLQVGLALVPLFGTQYARMMVMNMPDAGGDEAAGKRTLVVRLGVERAVRVHHAIQIASYGSLPLLALAGVDREVLIAILCTAPLAALQVVRLQRGAWRDPEAFNRLAFTSTLHIVSVGSAALIGFLL
jgi:1,4-dihydroxy-2-naphthoate octaprenyltransferase